MKKNTSLTVDLSQVVRSETPVYAPLAGFINFDRFHGKQIGISRNYADGHSEFVSNDQLAEEARLEEAERLLNERREQDAALADTTRDEATKATRAAVVAAISSFAPDALGLVEAGLKDAANDNARIAREMEALQAVEKLNSKKIADANLVLGL